MNDDTIEHDEEDVLAAEYALGLLSDSEARAFEDLLDIDPGTRDRYAFWAEHLAALTDDIPAVAPPADLKARLMERVSPAAARSGTPSEGHASDRPSLLQRLGLFPAIAGGLLAAVVVLGVVDFMIGDEPAPPLYVAELSAEGSDLVVLARYVADTQTLTLDRTAGAAAEGRSLQLWLIPEGEGPISLGVLPDDPAVAVPVPAELVPSLATGVLAISDEPEGGSPTDAPTGPVVAAGEITQA